MRLLNLRCILVGFLGAGCVVGASLPGRAADRCAALPHPPIPVRFTLPKAAFVTLVIEDASGRRVRNLVSETPFPAGPDTVYWDGLDDAGRDPEAAAHAIYHIPGKLVTPGVYRVRGLYRQKIDLRYQMTAYNSAVVPWHTADPSSEWLSNHTPPSSVLFVPAGAAPVRKGLPTSSGGQVLAGSYVSEGGSGLAWLDLEGRKLHGQGWIGGVWTGAQFLARDDGEHPVKGVYAYTGSTWKGDAYDGNRPELRLHELLTADQKRENSGAWVNGTWDPSAKTGPGDARMGSGEDRRLLNPNFTFPDVTNADGTKPDPSMAGMAVHNGLLVVSLPTMKELLFIDAAAHRVIGPASLDRPGGLAFDREGRLLALSGTRLLRFRLAADPTQLPTPEVLVTKGLEEPQQLTLDRAGNIYVSDRGNSQQVKVFGPSSPGRGEYRLIRAIGHPGVLKTGPYDPEHMSNPNGITIDSNHHLWVAETEFQPKRLSVWSLDGKLVKALYGPPRYGGGGELDPVDTNLFYYDGMMFRLDWQKGNSVPVDVFYHPAPDELQLPGGWSNGPQTPIMARGRKYLTNAFNSNPTNGANLAGIWLLSNGVARPVAAMGQASEWKYTPPNNGEAEGQAAGKERSFFDSPGFKSRLPAGASLSDRLLFAWSDLNGDGKVQPEEVTFLKGNTGGVTVMPDLSFVVSRVNDRAMRFPALHFTTKGIPRYDAGRGQTLAVGAQPPTSSGGDQVIAGRNGWTVLTVAPLPFAPQGMAGVYRGRPMWSYPSLWPGLHASHNAAMPDRPGELIGTTRLLGSTVTPRHSDTGEIWAINGNKGNIYLFTTDGLFVATLFKDSRTASWNAPRADRDMLVNDLSAQEEDFWPSITQTQDGKVYLQVLNACIVRVDGLETIHRLPATGMQITPSMLTAARNYSVRSEAARQLSQGAEQSTVAVALRVTPPAVDGNLDDWTGADWATIDRRTNQIGDWGHAEARTEAALAVADDRLYAAFKTGDPNLLNNSGESMQNLFKTGGALDLMLDSIPGGERLLVTRVRGKTAAVLYRPRVPGAVGDPVVFSSPLRTIKFDRVDDVSEQVILAGDGKGDYEYSVPLSLLGLHPAEGQSLAGDLGLLRGNGFETLQRVYWRNKETGLVSDIPSEAELTPQLWGKLAFKGAGSSPLPHKSIPNRTGP